MYLYIDTRAKWETSLKDALITLLTTCNFAADSQESFPFFVHVRGAHYCQSLIARVISKVHFH